MCHLERRATHHIVGAFRSRVLLLRTQSTTGQLHPWVYAQIQRRGRRLDQICSARDLWPGRFDPGYKDHW